MSLSKNLSNTIFNYLTIKDIANLSFTDKNHYTLINRNNQKVNSLWREEANAFFCDNDTEEIMNEHYSHTNDSNTNSEIDWKSLYIVMKNQLNSLNKNIYGETSEMVYKMFKYHIYLPNLRKTTILMDNNNSSAHQMFCFEYEQEEKEKKIYYENYFSSESNSIKFSSDYLDNLLQKYEEYKEEIKNDENKKGLLDKIFTYNIDSTNKPTNSNHILNFMLWLYNTVKYFCTLNLFYIKKYNHEDIRFLHEYINRHTAFIEAALCLKENLENVNTLINLLYHNVFNVERKKIFSIYKFIVNIWYKEVYLQINGELMQKVNLLIPQYVSENLLGKKEENSMNIDDEEFFSIRNIIEQVTSCVLDFSIDQHNIKYFNHTEFATNTHYQKFESTFISEILFNLQSRLVSREITLNFIFDLINYISSDDCLLLNRTKFILLTNTLLSIKEKLVNEIRAQFTEYIIESQKNPSIYCKKNNIEIDNSYIRHKVKGELRDIKKYLANLLSQQGFDAETAKQFSKDYINSKKDIVIYVNKMLIKFYENVEKFEITNSKIINCINKVDESTYDFEYLSCRKNVNEIKTNQFLCNELFMEKNSIN